MSQVDLAKVKSGVRATGFYADDVELQRLTDMAEAAIARYLRRDLLAEFADGLPSDLEGAVIAFVDLIYNGDDQRDYTDQNEWPFILKLLLSGYRDLS